ncbi:MAG: hypothetical protein N2Z62_04310 [Rhodobacteraceae bacterium]|nr:hypothetical protein [Paracoccaceae bacterium]
MSDPVARGEIEDVIASIRRLVSSAPEAHRLVLTEAHRIDRPPAPEPQAPEPGWSGAAGATAASAASDDDRLLEQAVAELEAELHVGSLPPLAGPGADRDYDPWEPVEAQAAAPSALDRIDVEIEAELQAEAEIVMFRRASEGGVHIARTGPGIAQAGSGAAGAAPSGPTGEHAFDRPSDQSGGFGPDAARAVQDVAPAGGRAENLAAEHAAENVARPDIDSLLDERDLRALVAEVLREELKGPLGERITRNVRKLVRREIAQALSSYDLR